MGTRLLRINRWQGLAVAGAMAAATAAPAHDSWLVAGTGSAAVGEAVRFAFVSAEVFAVSEQATDPERVAQWVVIDGEGRQAVTGYGIDGQDLAASVVLSDPGLNIVAVALHPRHIELEASDFNTYLTDEQAQAVLSMRRTRGEVHQPGREYYTKLAKAYVQVGDNSGGTDPRTPVGHTLEIVPLSDPREWRSGDRVAVRVLLEGEPAPGLRVSSGRQGLGVHEYVEHAVTDGEGIARLRIDEPGHWFFRTHMIRPRQLFTLSATNPTPAADPRAEWESYWASITFGVGTVDDPEPPVAHRRPVTTTLHGDTRTDDYAWLRDRDDPLVIEYLEAENDYARKTTAHTAVLQKALYNEMVGRIKQTDLTVPYRDGPYLYYSRTVEGLDYPIYCRKRAPDADEEIILDVNELAKGHDYYRVTRRAVSPDHKYLAYAVDTTGYEAVTIRVKDLATGALLRDVIEDAGPFTLAWANDGRTLYYSRTDESKRANRIFRHVLGRPPARDDLVMREDDVKFSISARRSRSDEYILIGSGSSTTSEVWFIDADDPEGNPRIIAPRRQGVRYTVDHRPGPDGGWFYVLTDADDCPNFKLVLAPVKSPGPQSWGVAIPHSQEVYLTGVNVFANFMVLSERRGGYSALRVHRFADGEEHLVELPEEVAAVGPSTNEEFETDVFRFGYTSLITPRSVFDYDMTMRQRTLLKQQEVLGGYEPTDYETRRLYATAADGARIPVSVVHRREIELEGDNPCLLYAYGSYGASMDPWFRSNVVSLLDRGFVYAIAHVRGGAEMGRSWKEDGKMFNKRNTFTDFIAVAEFLIEEGYTDPERLAIRGGSAGGLLIGAVVNMRPDLFAAAHAAVPFVDVLNTMLDPSIPLTTGEYEEWGDPNVDEYYFYIKSYSPYDNVAAQDYPSILITASLNDPRVHFWEPAKWAAKLRALKTDDNPLVLEIKMGAGHGGASGRYKRFEEVAFEYAFIIDRVGKAVAPRF